MRLLMLAVLGMSGATALNATAQWELQESHTTASLRGIHAVSAQVAWASGTEGTVLRTVDGGKTWEHCAVPAGAEKLDFRGVQAFDEKTAIVMSSGKGQLSKVFKTSDGCASWKLIFTNPDEEGFFDSLTISFDKKIYVLGDPARGSFAMFFSEDQGENWFASGENGRDAVAGDGAFAASNSALIFLDPYAYFVTGMGAGNAAHVYRTHPKCVPPPNHPNGLAIYCTLEWVKADVALPMSGPSAGLFSVAGRMTRGKDGTPVSVLVAVGGVYDKPNEAVVTAVTTNDGGVTWQAAPRGPQGYRSAVVYNATTKTWVAVGPNGTDVSSDDGKNWRALKPGAGEVEDADKNWNALSLPFVVGPKGRIGVLRKDAVR